MPKYGYLRFVTPGTTAKFSDEPTRNEQRPPMLVEPEQLTVSDQILIASTRARILFAFVSCGASYSDYGFQKITADDHGLSMWWIVAVSAQTNHADLKLF